MVRSKHGASERVKQLSTVLLVEVTDDEWLLPASKWMGVGMWNLMTSCRWTERGKEKQNMDVAVRGLEWRR